MRSEPASSTPRTGLRRSVAIGNGSFGSVSPVRRAIGFTPMETRRSVIVEMSMLADELGFHAVQIPEAANSGAEPAG